MTKTTKRNGQEPALDAGELVLSSHQAGQLAFARDQLFAYLARGGDIPTDIQQAIHIIGGVLGRPPEPALLCVTNERGIAFNVRIIQRGDKFGLNNKLTYDEDEPQIEFYDTRYPHTEYGQFVSRYYVKTLLGEDIWGQVAEGHGLCLHGGVEDWAISADNLTATRSWVRRRLGREVAPAT